MNFNHLILPLLLGSTCVHASSTVSPDEILTIEQKYAYYNHFDHSGFSAAIGYSEALGSLSGNGTKGGVTLDASYTFDNSLMLGINYSPSLIRDQFGTDYFAPKFTMDILGVYLGYHADNDFRFRLGFNQAQATVSSLRQGSIKDSSTGVFLGTGFVTDNQWTFDVNLALLTAPTTMTSNSGSMLQFLVGYKF